MKNKAKRPVFTYIITVLNAFVPTFITIILSLSLVMVNETTGDTISSFEMYYPSIYGGAGLCLAISIAYLVQIRRKRLSPCWWKNLLLILISYSAAPLLALAMGQNETQIDTMPRSGELTMEVSFLTLIGFIAAFALTRPSSEETRKAPEKRRFKSPFWILASIPIYYVTFFVSLLSSVALKNAGFVISCTLIHSANKLLRIPLITSYTEDLVKTYLPGPLAHIVMISNALIWGTALWFLNKYLRTVKLEKMPEPPPLPVVEGDS